MLGNFCISRAIFHAIVNDVITLLTITHAKGPDDYLWTNTQWYDMNRVIERNKIVDCIAWDCLHVQAANICIYLNNYYRYRHL